ncbi:hypothetical protein CDCA_CDCA07G2210 [Cyanidium caldarium]|uniref:Prostaglandin E synthase 2 n=1 Tax=Cyanidium caldarium TaxID=2771 RepID=A0AAV9IVP4_CYACA|nr:hypothetical protein CDCA_CDCA07G2210 [Cyanidium caldarium]
MSLRVLSRLRSAWGGWLPGVTRPAATMPRAWRGVSAGRTIWLRPMMFLVASGTAFTAAATSVSLRALSEAASVEQRPKSWTGGVVVDTEPSTDPPPAAAPVERLPHSLAELRRAEVVLYQYETCPFCNKLRAYLDYRQIPYRVVEVNPLSKGELKFSTYKKVPVLVVNAVQLNDSGEIIRQLERIAVPDARYNEQWFRWIDDWFVHTLPPNIYRTRQEALQTFDYITEEGNFTPFQRLRVRYFGAAAMYFVSRRLKKKYGIEDERQALYDGCRTWLQAVGWPHRRFMGGDRPDAADVAMFGVLRSIEHFVAFEDLSRNVPDMIQWYEAMKQQVPASARVTGASEMNREG